MYILEAVVMLGHRHDVLRARLFKEVQPLPGIKLLPLEQGNKVLVSKRLMVAIGLFVMGIFRCPFEVHVPGIPLVSKGRNGVNAPMDEDAELGVVIPFGGLVVAQRFPCVRIRAVGDDLVHPGKNLLLKRRLFVRHGKYLTNQ